MKVYVDNAATTPLCPKALEVLNDISARVFGNPSSVHWAGEEAAETLAAARAAVARVLGAKDKEIYFTSCGTESDNWAVQIATLLGAKEGKKHIVSTAFEHHAILHTLKKWSKQGWEVTLLPVHEDGLVRLEEVAAAIRDDTALVTIMYANNEIGTVQPIPEIGKLCRERGVLFHTDAVQAVGHLRINVEEQNIDMLSLTGHKFGAPKGVGALYCKSGIPISIFMEGGAQERGKRGGTENLASIASMAAALDDAWTNLDEYVGKTAAMRDKLTAALSKIPKSRLNGHPQKRLPGIVNFCFEGIEGEALLLMLSMSGICASSGSACTSGSLDPSHVILALGLEHAVAHGSLRLSLSERNSMKEVDYIIEKLPPIIERLRGMSPVWERIEQE